MHSTLEGFTEGTSEPFYSIDIIESTPIKLMTNTECRRFLKEDTNQFNKEIMCFDTTDLQYDSNFFIVNNTIITKRVQYISVKNSLDKQSINAFMCFLMRRVRAYDFMVHCKPIPSNDYRDLPV